MNNRTFFILTLLVASCLTALVGQDLTNRSATLHMQVKPVSPGHVKLFVPNTSHPYHVTRGKLIGWGVLALASATDGMLEGYGFDGRKSFERKFGADPDGFWGSQSWRSVYVNRDPAQGHRSWLLKQTGAIDFYHIADDVRKIGYISAGVTIGLHGSRYNSNWKHWAADLLISAAISAGAKRAGMWWVRN